MADEEKRILGDSKPGSTFSGLTKGRSTLEKCLIVVAFVLFITTITFLGLFVNFHNRYNETDASNAKCEDSDCLKTIMIVDTSNIDYVEDKNCTGGACLKTLCHVASDYLEVGDPNRHRTQPVAYAPYIHVGHDTSDFDTGCPSVSVPTLNQNQCKAVLHDPDTTAKVEDWNAVICCPGVPRGGKAKPTTCKSRDCVQTAAMMASKMNAAADPCEDFYEYACGRWYKNTILSDRRPSAGAGINMHEENQVVIRAIVTEPEAPEQPVYLQNMKRLYKSCVDEDQIVKIGLQPYLSDTAFVSDWPTLNPAWDASSFNLNDALARYAAVDVFPLFEPTVESTPRYRSLNLKSSYFSVPLGKEDNPAFIVFRNHMIEFAVALGADRTIAGQDSHNLMSLISALSKIAPPKDSPQNPTKMKFTLMTLQHLIVNFPKINLPHFLRSTFAAANVTLPDTQMVRTFFPQYFGNLNRVLSTFPSRTIQNLFGFKYAESRVKDLTTGMRRLTSDFRPPKKAIPRSQTCMDMVSSAFNMGLAKQFVDRRFPKEAKVYINEMDTNLVAAFKQIILETTWMGETTKKAALGKLATMRRWIGYPDVNFNDDDLNRKYINYVMNETDYFSNKVLIDRMASLESKRSLLEPVDQSKWITSPLETRAIYYPIDNAIYVLAAFAQEPHFSMTYQDSMNYGGIGTIIGHELTHGFDSIGSRFDKEGKINDWWHASDKKVFEEKVKCLIDQYSGFHISEINMNVNGRLTQNENIADNGGLKESYRAYKELVKRKGESPTLPDLGLSQDQLFFLANAQMGCSKKSNNVLMMDVKTGPHSPTKYRKIGTLQNSEDFSRAFNCPRGSYMNPEKKCSVW